MNRVLRLLVSVPGLSALAEHAALAVPRFPQKGGSIVRERRRLLLGCLLVAALLLMGATGGAAPLVYTADGNGIVSVNVIFKSTPHEAERSFLLATAKDVRVKYLWHLIPAANIKVPQASLPRVLAKLNADPRVRLVEPDGVTQACAQTIPWGVSHINAPALWAAGNKGTGIKVAVLDTGIDYTHSDLSANYHGGYDYANGDNNPMDDNGHGTHVSGTIAAVDNTIDVIGVAPEAWLYGVKVLDSGGSGSYSWLISGIQWAVTNGMKVCNMSLRGTSPDSSLQSACQAAYDAGVVLCAASGNDYGAVGYPAAYSTCIAVGATDSSDVLADWSNYGPELDFVAPGVNILSTVLGGGTESGWSGTSMACPHVSGVAALCVKAGYTTPATVYARMQATAHDLGASGFDNFYGYGLVDAHAADAGGGGEDSYEIDDDYTQANPITVNAAPQHRNNYSAEHVRDWVYFDAVAGVTYLIQTLNLGSGADTVLELYDDPTGSYIEYDDDGGAEPWASLIQWTCPATGTYYVKEREWGLGSPGKPSPKKGGPSIRTGADATYDLQVLVLDPNEDSYEVDDDYTQAKPITVNAAAQNRNNYSVTHKLDWAYFSATAGTQYTIKTLNLGANADTVLELYDDPTGSYIEWDDDGGGGLASRIVWTCPTTAYYYIQEYPYSDSRAGGKPKRASRPGIRTGADATYDLSVTTNNPPVASDDSYSAYRDEVLNVAAPGVLANDTDADGDPLTAVLDTYWLPLHGNVTLNANGSFIYTPDPGYTGTDDFGYYADDGRHRGRGERPATRSTRGRQRANGGKEYSNWADVFIQVLPPIKPDLWIRNAADTSWLGNNIYNADGTSQTKAQTMEQDKVATYYFRLYNDGETVESFRLTGPVAGAGWTVSYYISGVGEKTSDFTGGGYLVSNLAPGAQVTGWVNVRPGPSVPYGGQQVVLITGKSVTDPIKLDAVKAVTTKGRLRPDLWIRNDGDTSWIGNNIYNADGSGQTKTQTVAQDVVAAYDFRIYNDGDAPESFRLFGPAAGSGWTVSYYISGAGEKTSDFTGSGYLVSSLAVGAYVQGWVNVMPGSSVPSGGQRVVLITAKSVADLTKLDAVKAVTTKRSLRPDLWVRNKGEASWVGNNIYNADGTNQTKTQTVAQDVIATYDFRIYNDGNVTDSFRLTGPAAGSGWTVSYYISGVGEKTSDFTGGGYLVSDLAVGAYVLGWVNVRPGSGAGLGATQTVLITGKSLTSPSKLDAVKTVTTKGTGSPVLSSLTAVSARAGGTQIVFSLSAPAMVEARILNLAGRPIRTLCRDQACTAGTNTLLWDARSDAGLRVPNGTYLIQVTAKGPAGATSRALQSLVVGR